MSEHEQDMDRRDEERDPLAPDENGPEERDDEPGQTPAEAASDEGSAELVKKASKATENYHKRIAALLGDDPNRHECPRCEGLGFVYGEEAEAVAFRPADDAEPCEACDALGFVGTGSRVPGQDSKPCGRCGGRGWHEKLLPPPTPLPVTPTAGAEAAPLGGTYDPVRGFIPYGQTEPLPGTARG